MSNSPKYTVVIHDLSTDAAVETIPANNYHDAVRIMEGASINLDHERFYISIYSGDQQ